jgi:hypothetical protein
VCVRVRVCARVCMHHVSNHYHVVLLALIVRYAEVVYYAVITFDNERSHDNGL